MKYNKIIRGTFVERPNRFIAHVRIFTKNDATWELAVVHVKNTGRCKELLLPGCDVILEVADNPNRKTKYDLIAVYKKYFGWINIDSQAPNKVAAEWLATQSFSYIKPEYTYGDSRLDFYMERNSKKYLMEVKGCTLEINGVGYFPDAPTIRGTKHLHELTKAVADGYHCIVGFVIQMEGIEEVRPNIATDPAFGKALEEAKQAGVTVLFLKCNVTEDSLSVYDSFVSK